MRKQHGLQHFGLSRRMKMKIRAPFYYIEDWIKRKKSLTPEEPDRLIEDRVPFFVIEDWIKRKNSLTPEESDRLKQALLDEDKRKPHDMLGGCTVIRSTGNSKRRFPLRIYAVLLIVILDASFFIEYWVTPYVLLACLFATFIVHRIVWEDWNWYTKSGPPQSLKHRV